MNMPTGRVLSVTNNDATNATNVTSVDDKRVFYPINLASFPAEYKKAYLERQEIIKMLAAANNKLDGLFLPVINRLAPPPAGKEVKLAYGYGKFQYEYQPIKKKSAAKVGGLVFQPTE